MPVWRGRRNSCPYPTPIFRCAYRLIASLHLEPWTGYRVRAVARTVRSVVAAGVVRPAEPGAQSEVGELDVAGAVDEHVVRLDVAVDEAHPVHRVDRQHQLGDEEPRQVLVEDAEPDQQAHQVAAGDVLHHEVQVRRVLPADQSESGSVSIRAVHAFLWCLVIHMVTVA